MIVRMVHLSRPIALIHSERFLADTGNDPAPVLREVDQFAVQGILPATLERTDDGGWRMALHTARHVVWLHPTPEQDAFVLAHTALRRFADEQRLVAGALLLRATFHQLDVRDPLPGEQLWHEWVNLPTPASADGADAHIAYLDQLDLAVQAAREIEIISHKAVAPQRYVSRAHSGGGLYSFQLARSGVLTASTVVCVGEAPELRGRVVGGYGRMITVRFSPDADHERIRTQGTLLALPSDRVHRAQRDAVAQLRRGDTRNPGLLDILAAQRYAPYAPRLDATPGRPLDPDQLDAFQRALNVPDILTVLGPPGTGKTTTIVEVIRACAQEGQRVLLTSPTHRGVDNVLESLPPGLEVVRVGAEDSMSAKVQAVTSHSRAQTVGRQILADTAGLETLAEMQRTRPVLEWHLAHLHTQLQIVQSAKEELVRTETAIDDAVKRADAALRAQLAQAERDSVKQQSILATTEAGLTQSYRSAIEAQGRADRGTALAFAHRWHANQLRHRSERLAQVLPVAKAASEQALALRAKLRDEFETLVAQDPLVLQLRATLDRAQRALTAAWPEIHGAGKTIREMLTPIGAAPDFPPETVAGWAGFHTACVATLSMLDRRTGLLQEWHATIADPATDLEPEIARYADVVAVTCTGTDTSALIGELDFDLAIVDDAGQVSTPNLLVPLVRSRRAMLVGDHTQPPPVPGDQIRLWTGDMALADGEAERVTELLAGSGFELLFTRAPEPNAIWLRTQRRMPREIGEFASSTFYQSRLRSEHRNASPDPVFSSPFAMVNTADQPADKRDELEVALIAQLVAHSHRHYRDWAVVVASQARKELVAARLQEALGSPARVDGNVASADGFLDGERDLIVFGFTPSDADAGLHLQPRQFNATVTRARRQLVLVGDLDALQAAKDREFQAIVESLLDHLGKHGDLRGSLRVEQALGATAGQRS